MNHKAQLDLLVKNFGEVAGYWFFYNWDLKRKQEIFDRLKEGITQEQIDTIHGQIMKDRKIKLEELNNNESYLKLKQAWEDKVIANGFNPNEWTPFKDLRVDWRRGDVLNDCRSGKKIYFEKKYNLPEVAWDFSSFIDVKSSKNEITKEQINNIARKEQKRREAINRERKYLGLPPFQYKNSLYTYWSPKYQQ